MPKETIEAKVLKQMGSLLEQIKTNYDVQKITEAQKLFNDMLKLIKENDSSIFNALVAIDLLKSYLTNDFLAKHLTQPVKEEVKEGK